MDARKGESKQQCLVLQRPPVVSLPNLMTTTTIIVFYQMLLSTSHDVRGGEKDKLLPWNAIEHS